MKRFIITLLTSLSVVSLSAQTTPEEWISALNKTLGERYAYGLTVVVGTGEEQNTLHGTLKVEGDAYYEPGNLTVERKYLPFMQSFDTAVAYEKNSHGEYADPEREGKLTLAATTARKFIDQKSGEMSYSYVFCVNSPDFFSNDLLYNTSYANYEVVCINRAWKHLRELLQLRR